MRQTPRIRTTVVVALVAAFALTGCSTSMGGSDHGTYPDRAGSEAIVEGQDAAGDFAAPLADQALVITGNVVITADDPIAAASDAADIVTAAGGRIDARREYAPRDGNQGSAMLTLRIPAENLDDVLADLGKLGRVDETSTDSVDVGTQVRDLDTRITTLRATIARYTTWLEDADTTQDLIELESAISQRQVELETLEAQKRELDNQVALSTIKLTLRSESLASGSSGPTDFGSGLALGWNAFVGFWAGLLVVLGVLLPWLVLFGIIAAVIVWIVRESRERALDQAAAAQAAAAERQPAPPPVGAAAAAQAPAPGAQATPPSAPPVGPKP